jgi:hypothetical protein
VTSTRGNAPKHMIPARAEHPPLAGRSLKPAEISGLVLHTVNFPRGRVALSRGELAIAD